MKGRRESGSDHRTFPTFLRQLLLRILAPSQDSVWIGNASWDCGASPASRKGSAMALRFCILPGIAVPDTPAAACFRDAGSCPALSYWPPKFPADGRAGRSRSTSRGLPKAVPSAAESDAGSLPPVPRRQAHCTGRLRSRRDLSANRAEAAFAERSFSTSDRAHVGPLEWLSARLWERKLRQKERLPRRRGQAREKGRGLWGGEGGRERESRGGLCAWQRLARRQQTLERPIRKS